MINTTHLMEIMITLNSSFLDYQNRPKYRSNRIRGNVLMKEIPHMHIWTRSSLKQIGHPWKPINTSDLKLIWKSPIIVFFSSSLIRSHRSEAGTTTKLRKSLKLQGLRLASVLGFLDYKLL